MSQRISSPGPSWAVLSQPTPSSSPSTRTSLMPSDFDDMGNDEAENELFSPPIPKRKADENLASRKAAKLPRLDLSASQPAKRKSSSSTSGANNVGIAGPSRTQPAPASASRVRLLPQQRGAQTQARAASGNSSSDSLEFGGTLSQAIQKINAKEKEREKATQLRRPPLETARKKTCQPKNVRKVTTAALLRVAQRSSDSANESTARTRIRPKKKQLRLNLDKATARSRPLHTAKNRGEIIELTDSSDAVRRPRPSQASNGTLPQVGARLSANPIIITSGSEYGEFAGTTQNQTRRNRNRDRPPASTQSKNKPRSGARVPPPVDVEVISISDSDEDPPPRPAPAPVTTPPRLAPAPVSASTVKDRVLLPTPVSPLVHTAPVPPTSALAPTSLVPSPPPRLEGGSSQPPPEPELGPPPQFPYDPPPDDADDVDEAFFDFDEAIGGDRIDGLDWGVDSDPGLGMGMVGHGDSSASGDASASASAPANAPTRHSLNEASLPAADRTTPPRASSIAPEPTEEDTMFDSYINLGELDAANNREVGDAGVGDHDVARAGVKAGVTEDGGACRSWTPMQGQASQDAVRDLSLAHDGEHTAANVNDVSEGVQAGGDKAGGNSDENVVLGCGECEVGPNDIPGTPGGGVSEGLRPRVHKAGGNAFECEMVPNCIPVTPDISGMPGSGETMNEARIIGTELPVVSMSSSTIHKRGFDDACVSGPALGSPSQAQDEVQPQPQVPIQKPIAIPPPLISPTPSASARLAPTPSIPDPSYSVSPASSSSPRVSTTIVSTNLNMPDISWYKGIRFKRLPTEARENSFFSRALVGMRSMRKAHGGGREWKGKMAERGALKDGRVQSPSSVVEPVREKGQRQEGDIEMRDTTAVLADVQPERSDPSSSSAAAAIGLAPAPEKFAASALEGQGALSDAQNPPSVAESSLQAIRSSVRELQLASQGPQPPTQGSQRLFAPTSSRPIIAPPRVPRPHTPINLTDTIDRVRRDRIKAIGNGSGSRFSSETTSVTTKSSAVDGENSVDEATSRSGNQSRLESQVLSQPQPQPLPQSKLTNPSRTTGLLSRTPSLDSIRLLIAQRHSPLGQLSRSTTTSIPNPNPKPAVSSVNSSDTRPSRSSSESRSRPSPPSTSSGSSGAGKSPNTTRRSRLVPFEAFISPVHPKGSKDANYEDKRKEVNDASESPIATRTRRAAGRSSMGSQKPRSPQDARRQSASAAFESCIVRASPTSTAGTGDARVVKPFPRPPRPKRSSEGPLSMPLVPALIPPPRVSVKMPAANEGTKQMDVQPVASTIKAEVDSGTNDVRSVSSTSVDEWTQQIENESDDTDQLLDLASVHLGQDQAAEAIPDEHIQAEGMVNVPGEEAPVDNQSDGFVDRAMDLADEMEELSQATQQVTLRATPAAPGQADSEVMGDSGLLFDDPCLDALKTNAPTLSSSGATTPDLILPEDNTATSSITHHDVEERATSSQSIHGNPTTEATSDLRRRNTRRPLIVDSGDSEAETDECAAILSGAGVVELESDAEPVASPSSGSSRTASSTSLSRRSSRGGSLNWLRSRMGSISRDARSVDRLNILSNTTPLSRQPQDKPVQESSGGYRVVTWQSYVAEQRGRLPEFKLAKELPHSLQDHMNALPAEYRNSETGRKVFEAVIREATFGEPDAPPVEIFDNNIGEEITPQWEFVYTNEMWLGEGVPPPDVKNLKSCGCVGKCDPKSKTCACAKRQLEWLQGYIDDGILPATWPGSPFVYDSRGILQRPDCPIFECNQFCSCDDDCPNRVVQSGRKWPVHIVKTMHKGWGVFAGTKKIPRGSYVGIYSGELLTEQEGEERGRYYDISGRTYLFSIDFHHLKIGMQNPDDWENIYVVDAYHAGNFTRFLNHSCDPNCRIYACYINDSDIDKPLLAVFTTRDVEPWEELCFSYYGDIDEKREIIEEARKAGKEELVKDHAVYARCHCEADNCIGRLFS